MSAHTPWTPGPWKLETVPTSAGSCHKIGPFPSLGVYNETYACVYADSIRIGIDYGHNKVGDELLANASLIASAPALVSALENLVAQIDSTRLSQLPSLEDELTAARHALRLARGEA